MLMSSLGHDAEQTETGVSVCRDSPAADRLRTCSQCSDCVTSGGVKILMLGDGTGRIRKVMSIRPPRRENHMAGGCQRRVAVVWYQEIVWNILSR